MELNEKLQALRKQRGLTQEALAASLYVSRTAISKWESGRGTPSIDSLKAISAFFSVSVDELLSGDALLSLAEAEGRAREGRARGLVFGLLDCGAATFFLLPFFAQRTGGAVRAVSLLSLEGVAPYVKIPFLIVVAALTLWGVATLALQTCRSAAWTRARDRVSLGLSAAGALLFIVTLQPYAALLTFVFLVVKASMLIKWT